MSNETPRPLIDFSGDSRTTARSYARDAIGVKMKPEHKALLKAAADGQEVDAYAFNEVLTQAYRHGFTRCGSAAQRRVLQNKIGHLSHIVQAVLEAHADGLPVYADTGVRSRKIKALEEEIAENHRQAVEEGALLNARINDLIREKTEAEVEAANAVQRIYSIKDQANDEISRLHAHSANLVGQTTKLLAEREVLAATLAYALELLAPEASQRVLGFRDGVEAGLGTGASES